MPVKIIIFPDIETFNQCQNPLPSGQGIGEPAPDCYEVRYCMKMDWTEMDLEYFATLEGVTITNELPFDWYCPEE